MAFQPQDFQQGDMVKFVPFSPTSSEGIEYIGEVTSSNEFGIKVSAFGVSTNKTSEHKFFFEKDSNIKLEKI